MDKMIVAMGAALIALGLGFWTTYEMIAGLHEAYQTGGALWLVVGAITIAMGLKKKERLGVSLQKEVVPYSKNALGA